MTPTEQLAEIRKNVSEGFYNGNNIQAYNCIIFLLKILEQAKREAFLEAEALCDQWGTMHGGTAQRIKREIHKLAEEVK